MAQLDMIMPKMGESVAEATITKWLKNIGDKVEADESVLEIATDKVDSEVPAPKSGVLVKRLFNEGDVVQVGQVIAVISEEGTASVPVEPTKSVSTATDIKTAVAEMKHVPSVETIPGDRFYSPLVKSIAKEEGIGRAELDTISGSGKDGRVTKEDLLTYIQTRKEKPAAAEGAAALLASAPVSPASVSIKPIEQSKASSIALMPGDELVEMDRMRKLIADHMVRSKHTSPHVTSYVEADVTKIVQWREKIKKPFEKREGEKITFTPIFIEALVKAIKEFPGVNASVDGYNIIMRKQVNIGMATALPNGNLIVPVIKNADMMNLAGITKSVNDLANRARENKLTPDEISGGTFTLTNVGSFGNVMGTPIINQPQVAILAVGAIRKKPVVIETPEGDVIGIRHMMFLSHSYDHRVVDGALGGRFVRRVADILEAWNPDREI